MNTELKIVHANQTNIVDREEDSLPGAISSTFFWALDEEQVSCLRELFPTEPTPEYNDWE